MTAGGAKILRGTLIDLLEALWLYKEAQVEEENFINSNQTNHTSQGEGNGEFS
jgi:hypothetical protein